MCVFGWRWIKNKMSQTHCASGTRTNQHNIMSVTVVRIQRQQLSGSGHSMERLFVMNDGCIELKIYSDMFHQ